MIWHKSFHMPNQRTTIDKQDHFNKWSGLVLFIMIVIGIVSICGWYLNRPTFFVVSESKIIVARPIKEGETFSTEFIHSVQKTPVIENFILLPDKGEIVLDSTQYQSFGVGLPFMLSDGDFKQKGGYFWLENMDRHFPEIVMRTGVGTNLRLRIQKEEYLLYEMIPTGSAVRLYIAPYYTYFQLR